MQRWLAIPTVLVLIVGTGVAYGLRTDRWFPSHELEEITERLPKVPMVIGDWEGKDDSDPKFTERLIRIGALTALVARTYTDRRTGDVVSLLIATGKSGPIANHTPLTCIGDGGDYVKVNKVRKVGIKPETGVDLKMDENPPIFAYCEFKKADAAIPEHMDVYWSWHSKDGWVAVEDARVSFAWYKALTKIYVMHDRNPALVGRERSEQEDAAQRFVRECLPTINAVLYGDAAAVPDRAA